MVAVGLERSMLACLGFCDWALLVSYVKLGTWYAFLFLNHLVDIHSDIRMSKTPKRSHSFTMLRDYGLGYACGFNLS
jgi:hypothetical protein